MSLLLEPPRIPAISTINLSGTDPRDNNKVFDWTSEVEWPDQDIMVCRNALPFLPDLIAEAEKWGDWESSKVIGGNDEDGRNDIRQRNSQRLLLTSPEALNVHSNVGVYGVMLHATEGRFVEIYMTRNPHSKITRSSGFDLLRYKPGEFFGEHVDAVTGHKILGLRKLSVIAFCNDDFDGGELVFPRQGLTIEPEPAMLVLFPSTFTYPHEAKSVTRGVRYSVTSWYF